jgi:uroporphyrinogen decarboxylase
MQNSRELVDNLMRKRPAERVGLYENIWGQTLERWVTEGYPTKEDGKPVDPIDHFHYDLWGAGGWFDYMPLKGFSEVVEETDEWRVTRNGAGASFKYWKTKAGTPEHVDFRMTSREIWERDYRPHLLEFDRERLDIEASKKGLEQYRQKGASCFYGHMFVWETMRQTMGDLCMYESLVTDPEWIHDFNRVYTDFWKTYFKVLIEEAGRPDSIWLHDDLGYKGGLFASPRTLEKLILPYFAEIVAFFHSYDLPVTLHTCGGIEAALPLIIEAGFDGLNPMERKAGCDPIAFAKKYKDKLTFIGGLDARILESADKELIRKEVTNLIEGMKAEGASFIFASDHSISTNVSYDSYRYAIDVYREKMYY